ncbi:hypothetical protein B0T24DRAFT_287119 [Lasiosphaeria ovina]|uniref:Uncharacterized protein n=1 Tax=Lasiosphaeria ovina TaxID=92902 RepID=A0AAE0N7Z7_9PEZI|nr:hypothetical protein B0T24DRAFT_287119 [Lasiosphaeria ovina]
MDLFGLSSGYLWSDVWRGQKRKWATQPASCYKHGSTRFHVGPAQSSPRLLQAHRHRIGRWQLYGHKSPHPPAVQHGERAGAQKSPPFASHIEEETMTQPRRRLTWTMPDIYSGNSKATGNRKPHQHKHALFLRPKKPPTKSLACLVTPVHRQNKENRKENEQIGDAPERWDADTDTAAARDLSWKRACVCVLSDKGYPPYTNLPERGLGKHC